MKRFAIFGILVAAALASGCTRIETGEVGFVLDSTSRSSLVNCSLDRSIKLLSAMF